MQAAIYPESISSFIDNQSLPEYAPFLMGPEHDQHPISIGRKNHLSIPLLSSHGGKEIPLLAFGQSVGPMS